MKIGIIDADFLGRNIHRFPNLACMKISSFHKRKGDIVDLLLNYNHTNKYDLVYISKVFTDTTIPETNPLIEDKILERKNIRYDGVIHFIISQKNHYKNFLFLMAITPRNKI